MNMIREIDQEQYLQTMGNHMKNITNEAEALTDIWEYAEYLLKDSVISAYGFQNHLIEAVYINDAHTYQHVLLFTDQENCYVVIVIDVLQRTIFGHYILDLNKAYGINGKDD